MYEKPVQASEKALVKNKKIKKNTSRNGPQLKMRDKMYLLIKNLKTRRPAKKFDHIKIEPFLVNKVYHMNDGHQSVNYKLQLSKDAQIHPVFHILLLKPADPSTLLQNTFRYEIKKENEFEVETILAQES